MTDRGKNDFCFSRGALSWLKASGRAVTVEAWLLAGTLLLGALPSIGHATGGTVIVWGDNDAGQLDVPLSQTNVVAISAGHAFNLVLDADGTVVAWGDNGGGQTNVPSGLTGVTAVAAGGWDDAVLRNDGVVVNWGINNNVQGISDVIAIAGGSSHHLALKSDHMVIGWGYDGQGQTDVPADLDQVEAISAGGMHNLAVRSNGTVVAWGYDNAGQTDVPIGLSNVVAVAAGYFHSVALRADGTVVAWGDNSAGQTDVPTGLSNVVAIAAGEYHNLALMADSTVRGWGDNSFGQSVAPAGLTNVTAIAAGYGFSIAIVRNDGPLFITKHPFSQWVYATQTASMTVMGVGTPPLSYQWQLNGTNIVGATNAALTVTDAQGSDGGSYSAVLSDASGAIVSSNAVLAVVICPPVIVSQPPSDQLALLGTNLTLAVTAEGPVPIGYQWQFNGTNLPGATDSSLTLTNFQVPNEGTYTVIVTNPFLATNVSFHVTAGDFAGAVNNRNLPWGTDFFAPWYWIWPGGDNYAYTHDGVAAVRSAEVGINSSSWLSSAVDGPGTLSFWWMREGFPADGYCFSVDNTSQACLGADIYGQSGWQQILLYLPDGSHQLQWTFTRLSQYQNQWQAGYLDQVVFVPGATAPILTSTPVDQTVSATGSATFTAAAAGTPPLVYQWRLNGTNLVGATNTSLTLTAVQGTNAGIYSVLVTNEAGTNLAAATLTVLPVPPQIVAQPANQRVPVNGSASFAVTATGSVPFSYQWQYSGADIAGATASMLTLTNVQATNAGSYQAVVRNDYGVTNSAIAVLTVARLIAWGNNTYGQTSIPLAITNAAAVAGGSSHSLALNPDGTASAWGYNGFGQINVPTGLSNLVAVSSGLYHNLALKSDGTLVAWGAGTNISSSPNLGQCILPGDLSNVVELAAGGYHSVAVKSNGTVVAWGDRTYSQTNVPAGLSNVVAVAGGGYHTLALRRDGTVAAWGNNWYGQTNVPTGLTNVVAVAAGMYHSVVLRNDGTVLAWGYNASGQTNVPKGLTNVVSIACGGYHNMAIKSDGTLITWGDGTYGQTIVPVAVSNVVAIAAGRYHSLAAMNDGTPVCIRTSVGQTVLAGMNVSISVAAAGAPTLSYQWQFNGVAMDGATNALLVLTNVPLNRAGGYRCVVSNSLGSVVSQPIALSVLRTSPQFDSSGLQVTPAGFAMSLNALSGHGPIVLYASSNLVEWMPVCTNPPTLGTLQLLDASATNVPSRFYRIVEE